MDTATQKLVDYVKNRGVSISAISAGTGISRHKIYPSFSGERPLRADEFLAVCSFLRMNPMDFR